MNQKTTVDNNFIEVYSSDDISLTYRPDSQYTCSPWILIHKNNAVLPNDGRHALTIISNIAPDEYHQASYKMAKAQARGVIPRQT